MATEETTSTKRAELLDAQAGKLWDVNAVLAALAEMGEAKWDDGVSGDTVERLANMARTVLQDALEGIYLVRDQLQAEAPHA